MNWTSLPRVLGSVPFWLSGSAPGLHINRVYTRGFGHDLQATARAVLGVLVGDPAIVLAHGVPLVLPGDAERVRTLVEPLEKSVTWLNSGWRGWRDRLRRINRSRHSS